jgi:formylglycine-generating enzyme required for sulfatase activity
LLRGEEWVAAAAGAVDRPWPWGDEQPSADRLDACGAECAPVSMYPASDGWPATAPRGAFPLGASPDGVLDLAGNVAEWDADGAVRGGSWADVDPSAVGSRASRALDPASALPTVGFRCAADP